MAASGTAVLAANPSPKSTRAAIRRHVLDQIRSLQSQCFLARHGLARQVAQGYMPVSEELGATAAQLEAGGPPLWEELMAELRLTHLAG